MNNNLDVLGSNLPYAEILSAFESRAEMVKAAAINSKLLIKLFKMSIEHGDCDTALLIGETILCSLPNPQQALKIAKIYSQAVDAKANDGQGYILADVGNVVSKIVHDQIKPGELLLALNKLGQAIKDSASPVERSALAWMQDTLYQEMKNIGLSIKKTYPVAFDYSHINYGFIDRLYGFFALKQAKFAIRQAVFAALPWPILDQSHFSYAFKKFGLQDTLPAERFELCLTVLSQGDQAAANVALSVKLLNLQSFAAEDRKKIAFAIVKQGERAAAALAYCIEKFELQSIPIEERYLLAQMITLKGETAATAMASTISDFYLSNLVGEKSSQLIEAIILQGKQAATAVARQLDKFNLQSFAAEDRIRIILALSEQGEAAALALICWLEKFELHALSSEVRHKLAQNFILQGDSVAAAVVHRMDKFDLQTLSVEKRLQLAEDISLQGEFAAQALACSIDQFALQTVCAEAQYKLVKSIILQGDKAAADVARNIDEFNMQIFPVETRHELAQSIVAQGIDSAVCVAVNFDKFALQTLAIEERYEMAQAIISKGSNSTAACLIHLSKFNLQDISFEKKCELIFSIWAEGGKITDKEAIGLAELTIEQRLQLQNQCFDLPMRSIIAAYPLFVSLYAEDVSLFQNAFEDKLMVVLRSHDIEQELLIETAQLILRHFAALQLEVDGPVMQEAIQIASLASLPEKNNPFSVFNKLKALACAPSNFEPPQSTNLQVHISMKLLQSLAQEITREALPKNVSKQVFDAFYERFKQKIVDQQGRCRPLAEQALKRIDENLSWHTIDSAITGDTFLMNLLSSTARKVSEAEAKFKAVLSMVLQAGQQLKEGAFFTPQEEIFVLVMLGIQNCEGGKQYGIAFAYEQLPSNYRYNVALAKPKTAAKHREESDAAKALEFFQENYPAATKEVLMQAAVHPDSAYKFTQAANNLLQNHPNLENFIDVVDTYQVTEDGVEAILDAQKKSMQPQVWQLIGLKLQKLLANQLQSDVLMEELTGVKNVSQGSHHMLYLKNIIGPQIGLITVPSFDQHTGVLIETLLDKTREEILVIFFKHFTPEILLEGLVRELKMLLPAERALCQAFLSNAAHWDGDSINKEGAFKLLKALDVLVVT